MYSASYDRTVKLFDLSVMGYVETLFGHQDSVLSVDCLRGETAVTCGGRDKSVRFWKITDESQLVFRAGGLSKVRAVLEGGLEDVEAIEESTIRHQTSYMEGSVDCVAMIDESTFLSGGDSGCARTTRALWHSTDLDPFVDQYVYGPSLRKSLYSLKP
jgi:ribosomal RNA-processing protein 9